MFRHVCSRVYLTGGRCGRSAVLTSSIAAPKVPSSFSKVDDDDDFSPSPVKIYQGSSDTFNTFHVHDGGGAVRFFSGIRNIPRDEAMKYMPRLKKANSTEAIYILEDIERDGFIPDVFHYSAAISKCAKDGKLDEAKKIFRQMKKNKVAPNEFTLNSLIDACANAGDVEEAVKYLREMEEKHYLWPGVQSFSGAISACEKAGNWEKAIELLRESEHREIPPDVIIYAATISACGKGGQTKKALDLFIEMENRGIEPNGITFSAAISACEKGGGEHTETALALFREMCNRNICPTVITYGATISACEKGGAKYTDKALALFEELEDFSLEPEIVTYNALIRACGVGGTKYVDFSLTKFEEMKWQNIEPDEICFSSLIKACYDNKRYPEALEKAKEAASMSFLSALEAESNKWDLHGLSEAEACMLLASALILSVDTKAFRKILVITGKGKNSEDGPVLQEKVPVFLRDVAGLGLTEFISKNGKVNEGRFVITKKALQKWAKSDDYKHFRGLMTGKEKE